MDASATRQDLAEEGRGAFWAYFRAHSKICETYGEPFGSVGLRWAQSATRLLIEGNADAQASELIATLRSLARKHDEFEESLPELDKELLELGGLQKFVNTNGWEVVLNGEPTLKDKATEIQNGFTELKRLVMLCPSYQANPDDSGSSPSESIKSLMGDALEAGDRMGENATRD